MDNKTDKINVKATKKTDCKKKYKPHKSGYVILKPDPIKYGDKLFDHPSGNFVE